MIRTQLPTRTHGGPDAAGAPQFDFSTNSNACGPCPSAMLALQQADATRYPDPSYTALRAQLAQFHGVDVARVLVAGSASEFIFRITAWVAQQGSRSAPATVCVPRHAYGDYAQAAQAWGLRVGQDTNGAAGAALVWCCEPSSPLGLTDTTWPDEVIDARIPVVWDAAYAPLCLSGSPALNVAQHGQVWQMWSPNKALGLTGVRAAYVIAPVGCEDMAAELAQLAPSWPLGAHGVALLHSWVQPEAQAWLAGSLQTLRQWKNAQLALLGALGVVCLPSDTNFFCAQLPAPWDQPEGLALELNRLRAVGIKLRDAASFGLPGHVRLSVQPPLAQQALGAALRDNRVMTTGVLP